MSATATSTATNTFETTILSRNLGVLKARVADLNKVAAKLGVEAITLEVTGEGERLVRDTEHFLSWAAGVKVATTDVRLTGTSPSIEGDWVLLGTIEHADEGNYVNSFDDDRVSAYRDAGPDCDHCKVARKRNKTIVAADNATGEVVRVGTTCVKDFFGFHGSIEGLGRWLNTLVSLDSLTSFDDEDGFFGGGSGEPTAPRDTVLAATAVAIRLWGWVSVGKARASGENATAGIVRTALFPWNDEDREIAKEIDANLTDEDREVAADVAAWVAEIDPGTHNDYLHNLRLAASTEWTEAKRFGLVCSAVSAWARDVETYLDRVREAEAGTDSSFVGEVGDRIETEVEVTWTRAFDGHYGVSYLVKMVDDDGNVLKTFSSGRFGEEAKIGRRYSIRGTVKEHEVYNGVDETMLNRVAGSEVEAADDEAEAVEATVVTKAKPKVEEAEVEADEIPTVVGDCGNPRCHTDHTRSDDCVFDLDGSACDEFISRDVDSDECENCGEAFARHASECLEFRSGDCAGDVGWHSTPGRMKAFPRCEFHWERRLNRYDNSIERYANSDVAPGWFDPSYAGEEW